MQNQRGFVGVGVLIAILVGLAVLGGGAYYVVQQQAPTQIASDNFDNVETLPTNTTTSNPAPIQTQTTQTNTNTSATFSVPGSFTIVPGQTIKETGAATPVSITLKEMNFADGDVAVGVYCPMVELSNGVAPKQTVPICPGNPNYVPYLYQGLSFTITNSSATSASFSVAATTKAPAATIDASSLLSNLLSPTITGTGANLDKIRILMGTGASTVEADGNNGYVSIVNGRWAATFNAANFTNGKYSITVYHPSNRTVLATGVLTVKTQGSTSSSVNTTLSLGANGLGVINFGASPEQVVQQLTALFGSPTKDTGWTNSFSTYGTCPGNQIRVVEWNRLRVFFGDTPFGTQKFFQYEYTGRDTINQTPIITTNKGVTLGTSKSQVQALYPQAQIMPSWIENYEYMRLVPYNNDTLEYLGGTLQDGKVFWISGGIQCGE